MEADGVDPDPVADAVLDDRALLVDETLIIADLHLGRGRAANLELPVGDGADVLERIRRLLEDHAPDRLVLAGDVLHSFQTVPRPVRDAVSGIRDAAETRDVPVISLEGNHDTMLDTVWPDETAREVSVGDTVICHGHEPPEADADRYVIGHDHPTITIQGRRRPCYLVGGGMDGDANLVMLPPFNRLIRGVEVNGMSAADFQSPLVDDVDGLAPVVWDEDERVTLAFPPLGEFRHRL